MGRSLRTVLYKFFRVFFCGGGLHSPDPEAVKFVSTGLDVLVSLSVRFLSPALKYR